MKKTYVLAILIFILAAGLVIGMSPRRTKEMQAQFLGMLTPFLKTGSALEMRIREFTEGLKTLDELEKENRELHMENARLKAINQLLKDLDQENRRLRAALDYRERSLFKLVPAQVIARDSNTWWSTVRIDRGFKDGIESDMAVLTEEGLVGKTTTVARDSAIVLLIADEACKVAAKVEGSREQGILSGGRTSTMEDPKLILRFLSKDANLQPGQKVYTSGVGGVFDSGILIGTIDKFEERELDGQATVIPAVDFSKLRDIFIVSGMKEA